MRVLFTWIEFVQAQRTEDKLLEETLVSIMLCSLENAKFLIVETTNGLIPGKICQVTDKNIKTSTLRLNIVLNIVPNQLNPSMVLIVMLTDHDVHAISFPSVGPQ